MADFSRKQFCYNEIFAFFHQVKDIWTYSVSVFVYESRHIVNNLKNTNSMIIYDTFSSATILKYKMAPMKKLSSIFVLNSEVIKCD